MSRALPHSDNTIWKVHFSVNDTKTVVICLNITEFVTNLFFAVIIVVVNVVSTIGRLFQVISYEVDMISVYLINFIDTRLVPMGDKNVSILENITELNGLDNSRLIRQCLSTVSRTSTKPSAYLT